MPELNVANRQVCDVDIRNLSDKSPFLFFNTANTTTTGITGDSVYARAKGVNRIAFPNPIGGTMTIEAQVYPFRLFALYSDGVVRNDATYSVHQTITATTAGSLPIAVTGGTIVSGSVFVTPAGEFNEDSVIEGTFADNTFTATTASEIVSGTNYEVGFIVARTSGVNRIEFGNSNVPKDYFITMSTLDKDEDGVLTPFMITAYKAYIQRNFELSFSSDGDPASITMTFDLLEDKNGKFVDFVEITEDITVNAG